MCEMHPHSLKLTCSPTPTPVHTHTPRASQPECMLLSQQPQQEHPTKKIDNPSPGYIKFTFPPSIRIQLGQLRTGSAAGQSSPPEVHKTEQNPSLLTHFRRDTNFRHEAHLVRRTVAAVCITVWETPHSPN